MLAIINCPQLQITFPTSMEECKELATRFRRISYNNAIVNFVGCDDGYLLGINVPPRKDAGNVRSYFNGYYHKYGINVQACCNSDCMFTYFALSAPGSTNDRVAIQEEQEDGLSLHNLIERLPLLYVIIGDAAYKPSEHLVSIFYGNVKANPLNDNFNYYASQCRVCIEMAFGLMTAKWGILHRPLQQKLGNIKYITYSIARLHNFCIREKISQRVKGVTNSCINILGILVYNT
jgi:hypothetical protein